LAALEGQAPSLGHWLRDPSAGSQATCIGIGPEGGWAAAEAERFKAAGFEPVVLGDLTLRAETAAIAAAAAFRLL
jgi:16S rRNA (uracil1498-N3)-methyltransferase